MDIDTWGLKVIYEQNGDDRNYFIAEVYYDKDGKIVSYVLDGTGPAAMAPCGNDLNELRRDLEHMKEATYGVHMSIEELNREVRQEKKEDE